MAAEVGLLVPRLVARRVPSSPSSIATVSTEVLLELACAAASSTTVAAATAASSAASATGPPSIVCCTSRHSAVAPSIRSRSAIL